MRQLDARAGRELPVLRRAIRVVARQVAGEVVVDGIRGAREARGPHEEGIGLRHREPRAGIGRAAIETAVAVVAIREEREPGRCFLRGRHAEGIVFLLGEKILPGQFIAAVGRARREARGIGRGETGGGNGVGGRADHQRAGAAARGAVVAAAGIALVADKEVAVIAREVVAVHMLVGQHGLSGIPHLADGRAVDGFLEIAIARETLAAEYLGAVQVTSRNDVDHAGHGIRAVDRRSAVGHHFHAAHRQRRQDRRIGAARIVGDAVAVDHDQRGVGTHAAQVHGVAIDDVARAAVLAARVLADAQVEVLRQVLDDAVDGDLAGIRERIAIQRDDGGTHRFGATHTTARHDYFGEVGVFRFCGVDRHRADHHQARARQRTTDTQRHSITVHHEPPGLICSQNCQQ
jgi:hypothetical protein